MYLLYVILDVHIPPYITKETDESINIPILSAIDIENPIDISETSKSVIITITFLMV